MDGTGQVAKETRRERMAAVKRLVVKLGTTTVTGDDNQLAHPVLRRLVKDVVALREALKDGTLDMIATDHAPHHYEAKERDFDDAPLGIVGLETALGLGVKDVNRVNLDARTTLPLQLHASTGLEVHIGEQIT